MGFSDSTNRDALSFIPWMLGLVSSKILVDGSKSHEIRKRESLDDLINGESLV